MAAPEAAAAETAETVSAADVEEVMKNMTASPTPVSG